MKNANKNYLKQSFFVDPILKTISFKDENYWMHELVETPEFQRLSRIHQLGLTYCFFPSATHTRLSHSLGTYQITKKFINQLKLNQLYPEESKHLLCAALIHDLGHGPLSHSFEKYTNISHEQYSKLIFTNPKGNIYKILKKHNINLDEVIKILSTKSKFKWATELIDSQIDADRMDYLMRDSWYTGAAFGQINPDYLIKEANLINGNIVFNKKAVGDIENLLIGRYHMYKQVYNNPKIIAKDFLVEQIFRRVKDLYKQNFEFKDSYGLFKFFIPLFENKIFTTEQFLQLDDYIFLSFIESLHYEDDEILKNLYKAYNNNLLVSIKRVNKKSTKINKSYFCGIVSPKITEIYHKDREPIYILDNNKILELSQCSRIINKLSSHNDNSSYLVEIKH